MRSDIVPGGTFPDYELPDQESVPRKLSEIQGEDPLILTLARGNYCPKEHQQHLELAANYPKIAVAYTKVATISTDTHHSSQELRLSTGAPWPFLSDPERTVQKDLDIQILLNRSLWVREERPRRPGREAQLLTRVVGVGRDCRDLRVGHGDLWIVRGELQV